MIGRHQMRVQPIGVERRPALIRSLGGVLHQHVGVVLRVAGAAHAVLERDPQQPPAGLVADRHLERLRAGRGDLPAYPVAATAGQQADALRAREAVVKRRHPPVDPLALVLPRLVESLAVQAVRVDAEHLAGDPLDGLDLDPPGGARRAGCLYRADVPGERLGRGEGVELLDTLRSGLVLQGRQQRRRRELRPRVGAQKGGAAHLAGRRVQPAEQRPHLLGGRGPLKAAGRGVLADPAARGLPAAGEVRLAVTGDLVQPVALLADLERLDRQRQPRSFPGAERVPLHRRCGCVVPWN